MVSVELMPTLTDEHKGLVLRYLGQAERFSLVEWVTLLEAFTVLANSIARLGKEALRFQDFYDRFVDHPYSDGFISDLLTETDIPARASTIQAGYARQIYKQLCGEPHALGKSPETECLLAYCLYCDFYITRLYDVAARRYVRIVLLTEQAWRRINGGTVSCDLARAAQFLPHVVSVTFLGYHLVLSEYEIWKRKVLRRLEEGGERP